MIQFSDLLSSNRVLCNCDLKSKKRTLQTIAEILAQSLDNDEVSEMGILDALISREKLGSTGLGHGVALPHGRIKNLEAPIAAIITLEEGVDFGASDDQLVDLVMGLIVPENCEQAHLSILANLAQIFNQSALRDAMRQTKNPEQLLSVFLENSSDPNEKKRAENDVDTEDDANSSSTSPIKQAPDARTS